MIQLYCDLSEQRQSTCELKGNNFVKKELISSGVVHMLMLGRQFTNNNGETTL